MKQAEEGACASDACRGLGGVVMMVGVEMTRGEGWAERDGKEEVCAFVLSDAFVPEAEDAFVPVLVLHAFGPVPVDAFVLVRPFR